MTRGTFSKTNNRQLTMPDTIPEAWEYWTPSEEWAEAFAGDDLDNLDRLPRVSCDRTGKQMLDGFRKSGRPDSRGQFRYGRAKRQRGRDRLPLMRCEACPRYFTPAYPQQRFCCVTCGNGPRLTARQCAEPSCGCVYQPRNSHRVYCSRQCADKNTARRMLRYDWSDALRLYQQGFKLAEIGRVVGVERNTVREAIKRAGVWTPGRSGPKQVLPDAVCQICSTRFRPRKSNNNKYCSKKCFGQSQRLPPKKCEGCGDMFNPKMSRTRFCGYKCSGPASGGGKKLHIEELLKLKANGLKAVQIAERLGCAAVTVRAVLRKHHQQEQRRGEATDTH